MKSVLLLAVATASVLLVNAQGETKPPASPPAAAKETIASGAVVSINYSQPSVKGRTIGKDLEPMEGKVWRAGANKATTFEVSKEVQVEGKKLAAGKYSLFTIMNGEEWTIIFNKTWDQWGAYDYKEADDALRVKVKGKKAAKFSEKMVFSVSKAGTVTLLWGDHQVDFAVK